jgi:hypothetical protein
MRKSEEKYRDVIEKIDQSVFSNFRSFPNFCPPVVIEVHSIQFNSIQFSFINPNGNYKLLSLLRTIEQELKKKTNSID